MDDHCKINYIYFFLGLIFILVVLPGINACSKKTFCANESTAIQNKNPYLLKYKPVTVIDFRELDGCNFILKTDDGKNLIPENLADSLRKNQLKLWIQYSETNKPNICMSGKTIFLLDVRLPADR